MGVSQNGTSTGAQMQSLYGMSLPSAPCMERFNSLISTDCGQGMIVSKNSCDTVDTINPLSMRAAVS